MTYHQSLMFNRTEDTTKTTQPQCIQCRCPEAPWWWHARKASCGKIRCSFCRRCPSNSSFPWGKWGMESMAHVDTTRQWSCCFPWSPIKITPFQPVQLGIFEVFAWPLQLQHLDQQLWFCRSVAAGVSHFSAINAGRTRNALLQLLHGTQEHRQGVEIGVRRCCYPMF